MKNLFLISILLFWLGCQHLLADSTDVYIMNPNLDYHDLEKNVFSLEDKEGKLTLDDVRSEKYAPLFEKKSEIQKSAAVIWARVQLQNQSEDNLWLLESSRLTEADIYVIDTQNNVAKLQTAIYRPIALNNYRFSKSKVAIWLDHQPKTIYIRYDINSNSRILNDINLLPKLFSFKQSNSLFTFNMLFDFIIYGFIISLGLYNFVLYFYIKDKSYLFYTLFVFSFLFYFFFINDDTIAILFDFSSNFRKIIILLSNIFVVLIGYTFISFSIYFLNIQKNDYKWYKYLNKLRYYTFVANTTFVILYNLKSDYSSYFIFASNIVNLLILLSVIALCYSLSKSKNLLARYYIYANLVFFFFILIYLLDEKYLGLYKGNLFTEYSAKIGVCVQLIWFSIALAGRINILQREITKKKLENEQLEREKILQVKRVIEEKNAELEQKVIERTSQLAEANEELLQTNEELITTLETVEIERQKSDKLLLNILPLETANELKEKGVASPKRFEKVSILFTDLKGFTHIAAKMPPEEVVENLNYCFTAFDRIVKKYHLEKIKTIGDAYMCAGGLPTPDEDNPKRIILAAKEMVAFMQNWKAEKAAEGKEVWDLRLGIHTGAVVAGVVGEDKFAYDIWGDTVNTASRMESSGEPSKINISEDTYQFVKEEFNCVYRGEVEAKNKGKIKMYFVE